MNETAIKIPLILPLIEARSHEIGFTMPSDRLAGSLLRSLVCSKPGGRFLEMGTGIGLSLAWMLDGMDSNAHLTTIDNDDELLNHVKNMVDDERIDIVSMDGTDWIMENKEKRFDLIFADTWPGKYHALDETLFMVKPGGFYVVDDMNPQPNWPEGHDQKAASLHRYLVSRDDFRVLPMDWATGMIVCVKKMV